ncbi:MAG: hypothetical protein IK061_06260, partial [Desulfovibrio sp.]|nr:hypothetical protein [Desulfovibrio sp.]
MSAVLLAMWPVMSPVILSVFPLTVLRILSVLPRQPTSFWQMLGLRLRGAVLDLPWNRLAVPLAQMIAPTSALVVATPPSPEPSGTSRG